VLIRELDADDLPVALTLLEARPWDTRGELQAIAVEAAGPPGREHEALCADSDGALAGVVLFRFVAGAVHTGEIECVAAGQADTARTLLTAAIEHLREGGARIIVAEYPGGDEWAEYAGLLERSGFVVQASIADYFADGKPLAIAVLGDG
jgi:ribosomal protein S18 acetylase RimI-like enzyme